MCPACKSLERHRLIWKFLEERSDLFNGAQKKVLHIALEKTTANRLSNISYIDYLSADIHGKIAMVPMDITEIGFRDDIFDVIYCSHVLEHIPEDRKAMKELSRVLKTSGWAVLQVPIRPGETIEAPEVTDPGERLRLFGYPDHVRSYGSDYVDRLRESGFRVEVCMAVDFLSEEAIREYTPSRSEKIHFCAKERTGA
jgi:SAM-dependent methyltransferase